MEKIKKNEGITLIALVVTIVVLLILAGITISYVFRDNGVFGKASEAKIQTELSKIEEAAGIVYSDLIIQKHIGKVDEVRISDIVDKLERQGFDIDSRQVSGTVIHGIEVSPKDIIIVEDEIATITVKIDSESGENLYYYYAIVDGKYYPIKLIEGGVQVKREPENPISSDETTSLEVAKDYDKTIVKSVVISDDKITITGGSGEGVTDLTIKYGSHTDSCTVKSATKATSITAKELRIVEKTEGEIIPAINPSDARVKLKYTTTDTSKITVEGTTGKVIAKTLAARKESDTATVTITDAITGKTGTCNITILKEPEKGAYIQYNVSYKDMYGTGINYTANSGWRLLSYQKNADGSYRDVQLISTGIPANLHYYPSKDVNNSWKITNQVQLAEFHKKVLGGSTYTLPNGVSSDYSDFRGMWHAAGLYYNFGKVKFSYNTTGDCDPNMGWYTSIRNGTVLYGSGSNATGKELFETSEAVEGSVRLLTLPEFNRALGRSIICEDTLQKKDDPDGLYNLYSIDKVPRWADAGIW